MEYISDRLEQILILLGEASQPLTSAQLAEKVKVSARTVKKRHRRAERDPQGLRRGYSGPDRGRLPAVGGR